MTMKHTKLILLFSLLFSTQAFAWSKVLNFDELSDGATEKLGFSAKTLTRASNNFSYSGNMSIEIGILQGTEGFSDWGGQMRLPPKSIPGASDLKEGSEVWYRIWYYFPAGFDFSATGAGLKLSRIHTASSSGGHEGYMTLLIRNGIGVINPIDSSFYDVNKTNGLGTNVPTGQWHAIEHYVKFHSVPGKAAYRVWQNGKLIFEDTQSTTLKSSSSEADYIYFFTYWNGGAPKTQKAYLDDMIVTTDTPSALDSHGNHFIGVGDVKLTAAPNPPILLN